MNTNIKNDFGKGFFKLMNNAIFEKIGVMWENIKMLKLSQQIK